MSGYLLDADLCIHLIRHRAPPAVVARFLNQAEAIGVSTVVLTELLVGVEKSEDRDRAADRVSRFLASLRIHAFDAEAARHAAAIRARLERSGLKIGPIDTLIAGHARSLGATLVTGNAREFSRVPGLLHEDWVAGEVAP